jgi:hypothetical protein
MGARILFKRPLRKGDSGKLVEYIQQRLRELGFIVSEYKIFGNETEIAIKEFQGKYRLRVDGVVGRITWARLFPLLFPNKEYIEKVLYKGQQVYDAFDEVVTIVAAGEGGAFDALQLNGDGAGLSFGVLQWAQGPGSLQPLLQAFNSANEPKFIEILGDRDPPAARDLLAKTQGRGKKLALWQEPWPWRFWLAGRDLEFQQVQRRLARWQLADLLKEGYSLYPERFKPGGRIALRALMMMADVGNQGGPLAVRRALGYAASRGPADEARFIEALGDYVENLIRRKYGDPNYGNTAARHEAICRACSLEPVDWPALRARLALENPEAGSPGCGQQ